MNSHEFLFEDEVITTTCERTGDGYKVEAGGKEFFFQPIGPNLYRVNINGTDHRAAMIHHRGTYYIDIDSVLLEVKEPSANGFAGSGAGHTGQKDKIFAPMPGKIVKILVAEGDEIDEKQPMVIVEAMKMENQVNSKAKGRVKAVNFAEGDQVDTETPIIELELDEPDKE